MKWYLANWRRGTALEVGRTGAGDVILEGSGGEEAARGDFGSCLGEAERQAVRFPAHHVGIWEKCRSRH